MHIARLHVRNVRIIEEIQIAPGKGINFICGVNASGKTSLLEAIYILSRGRSFRTPRIQEVISRSSDSLLVSVDGHSEATGRISAGIEKTSCKTSIKFNGVSVLKISEQVLQLPTILITPESRLLVAGDPRQRRHWLDWAMFHVEPSYLDHWRSYHRALRQRNHLLQQGVGDDRQHAVWEDVMEKSAGIIAEVRKTFINSLQQHYEQLAWEMEISPVEIELQQGWPEGLSLGEVLDGARKSDLKSGYTKHGIHRMEVMFNQEGRNMAKVFSRGEIKRFTTMLLIAQARLILERLGSAPVILIDDLAAELDFDSRQKVRQLLKGSKAQVFLTMTDGDAAEDLADPDAVFHVEHGKIRKMIN